MENSAEKESSLKEIVEELVEETIEEQDKQTPKVSVWKRMQTSIMMIAALMITAGQFNDTKDIFTSLYKTILANFTHSIEYDMIKKIHIGSSLAHIKSFVGEPHAIKRSKLKPEIQFYYYSKDKYNLTLISSDERIVGYSVFAKLDGFVPMIPFAERLGSKNLNLSHKKTGAYSFDIGNLVYYIESQDLGKQQMFLTLMRGYVEYGALTNSANTIDNYSQSIVKLISALDQQATFSDDQQVLLDVLTNLRKAIYPNFYAVTELEPAIIAEALLTRYEYQMFTRS